MANIKSAKKRVRQNPKRQSRNRQHITRMRTAIKKLRTAIESGDTETAQELLPRTLQVIDRTAGKGVVHANTAARYKSRLSKSVQRLAG